MSRGALRLRPAVPIQLPRPVLEGADHPPQRAVEHLAGQALEDRVLEGEVDAEVDLGAAPAVRLEDPAVLQIFERPLDIFGVDPGRPLLLDPRGESFLDRPEA